MTLETHRRLAAEASRGIRSALLERDLRRICDETGFEPPRFDYTHTGRIPKLTRHRWPRGFRGRWFSDNLGLLACKKAK
jgi:hypothetical protein